MTAALATIGLDTSETWLPVEGKPYEVSDLGNVRRIGGQNLKFRPHTNGYLKVSLGYKNDSYVHRLVCQAFYGCPPDTACHADHINGVRTDNRAANLRWLTPQANRALRKIRKGDAHPFSKLTADIVRFLRSADASSKSDVELAEQFGVHCRTVNDARAGRRWRHVQ